MAKGSSMGKDPAVSWFFNDFMGGTMGFTRHQKGCYMDVLAAQFNLGHLSLEVVKTVLGSDFGQVWPTLQKKFCADDKGLFFNKRLEFEINKRQSYSKGREDNLSGGSQSDHMGIGIENEIELVLEFLNVTTSSNYNKSVEKNRKHVRARIKEGYKPLDFEDVIRFKFHQWGQDQKMKEFLRPETLFSPKFDGYLQAARMAIVPQQTKIQTAVSIMERQKQEIEQKHK